MPPQSRLTDLALNPADAHGCPACAHPVVGPSVNGSPDVLVNGLLALRVTDPGVHAACCGPNQWRVARGSSSVFINDKAAARLGDMTQHCGGVGNLITGAPTVITGG